LAADNATNNFDPAREGLLAAIDRRSGKADQAAEIYKRLLDTQGTTPDVLASAAEFFSLHNQVALSDRCLDRLAKMPLQPGTIDILRAHLLELRGNPQQAMQTLREAVKAHPESEQLWREFSGFYLRRGQLDMADQAAQSGLRSSPNSQVLAALRTQIGRLRTLAAQDVGPLLEVISHDPQQPIASQAIQLMAEAKARKESTDATLASLRRLSDEHPDFLPLAELLVQQYAQSGRLKDATDRALRATQIAPSDAEPLRLLCSVQGAAGNYDQARDTAQRWKQISADPLQPDLAIAATYLQQPQPDPQAALKQLAPYESDASTQPARQQAVPLYARALIMSGRDDEAAKLLKPLIEAQPAWRLTWMQLAAVHKDASAASAWLRQVVPSVPADAAAEKLALAQAWEQIGSKFDSAEANESARDLLKPLIEAAKVQPEVWAQWAAVNQSLGNLPEAERAWRECLKLLPGESHAQNNLAYVLLLAGTPSGLSEAERLATAAIAAEPNVSTFYDTLARIQLRLGKTDDAIKSFRTALDRSPANVEAMIGLADVLETQPAGRDEARSLLLRIDAASQGGPPLAPPLRKQLDRVKGALSSVAN